MRVGALLLLVACTKDVAPPAPPPRAAAAARAPTAPPAPPAPPLVQADRVIAIATKQDGPTKIAVTATDVLWINESGGQIMKAPKDGGPIVELARDQQTPLDLTVDATSVYWTTRTGPGATDSLTDIKPTGGVWSVPLSGGKLTAIATKRAFPDAIAVDASGFYVAEQGAQPEQRDGRLSRIARRGGAVTTLQHGVPGGIIVDGDHLYWSQGGSCVSINGAMEPDDGSLWSSPLATFAPKQLAAKLRCPEGIATDADAIYVANMDEGTILRIPKAGGPPVVIATDEPGPRWVAVDATTVYWVNQRTRNVKRRAKAGGPIETLVHLEGPQGIAVDDRFVYVADTDAGLVGKIAK